MNICAEDKEMPRKVGRSSFGNMRQIWVGCFLVCVCLCVCFCSCAKCKYTTCSDTPHTSIRIKAVLQCLCLTEIKTCALTSLPAVKKASHRERENHFILLYVLLPGSGLLCCINFQHYSVVCSQ